MASGHSIIYTWSWKNYGPNYIFVIEGATLFFCMLSLRLIYDVVAYVHTDYKLHRENWEKNEFRNWEIEVFSTFALNFVTVYTEHNQDIRQYVKIFLNLDLNSRYIYTTTLIHINGMATIHKSHKVKDPPSSSTSLEQQPLNASTNASQDAEGRRKSGACRPGITCMWSNNVLIRICLDTSCWRCLPASAATSSVGAWLWFLRVSCQQQNLNFMCGCGFNSCV